MNTSLNKTDDLNGSIVIEIEKSDYQEKVEKSLQNARQKANIHGFRPGKAPKELIRKMYGKAIKAEEVNDLVAKELREYIKTNDLHLLGEPLIYESDELDLETDDNLAFKFDVAFAPEIEIELTKKDNLIHYNVLPSDEAVENRVDVYRGSFGSYKTVEDAVKETDLLRGTITQLENGEPKENGLVEEEVVLTPSYMKDKDSMNLFVNSSVGNTVVFNPHKAYNGNEIEIASLLRVTKDESKDMTMDFSFEITEVTRFERAELNQELFDKVFTKEKVETEEEFREKVRELVKNQISVGAETMFTADARKLLQDKLKETVLPEEFLRRWLLSTERVESEEHLEEIFPYVIDNMKRQLIVKYFSKNHDIKVESEDLMKFAGEVAVGQLSQYGVMEITPEIVDRYAKSLMKDEETVERMLDVVFDRKVASKLKEMIDITEKEVSDKEFLEIQKEKGEGEEGEEEAEDKTEE